MAQLQDHICDVRSRISQAARKAGRGPEDITLVAVTKTVEADVINEAIRLGIKNIGENRVQEIRRKYEAIDHRQGGKWHLIGHLQTNKVKYIIDKVDLIHSVDSYRLAEEINKQAERSHKTMDILVQVNVSGEESKFGISAEQCHPLLTAIAPLPHIKVRGLMTMAPYADNPEQARPYFKRLKDLAIDIKTKKVDNINMDYLSMGMTGDFEVAIEEGANIVRIGTALFGKRSQI